MRTLTRDLARYVAAGKRLGCSGCLNLLQVQHESVRCYQYDPFRALSGVEAIQAWKKVVAACFHSKPHSLADPLALLHRQL